MIDIQWLKKTSTGRWFIRQDLLARTSIYTHGFVWKLGGGDVPSYGLRKNDADLEIKRT